MRQVDAKYPALLFKQQLTAYVEKIFGIIRDNLKKELTSLLSLCIQVSRILRAVFSFSLSRTGVAVMKLRFLYVSGSCQVPRTSKGVLRSGRSFGKDTQTNYWQSIIECLNMLLCTLKENFVWILFGTFQVPCIECCGHVSQRFHYRYGFRFRKYLPRISLFKTFHILMFNSSIGKPFILYLRFHSKKETVLTVVFFAFQPSSSSRMLYVQQWGICQIRVS